MHRLTLNTLVGMLALTTSGSEPNTTKLNNSSAFPSAAKIKISKKSNNAPAKPKTALAQNPTNLQNSAGLIKSTDAKNRAKEVLQGRTDPFSGISAPLPVEPEPTPQKVFPKLPQLPVAKELPVAPPEEPPKPKASLAKAISVEGVMGIGNSRHAIVKLPDDASSRYVAEGQELLGGRVIVKAIKIDPTNSDDPTVIFEQNGVEVAASVGFKPDTKNNADATESGSTVASTSSPMSILTADVAAKRVSSKPIDEVAYHPPSSPVSSTSPDSPSTSPDSQGIKDILSPAALLPELKAQNTRVKPYQQQPIDSKSVSVALNELPRAQKFSAPTGFDKNKLDAKSVDLKPRSEYSPTYSPTIASLSSTERYKQLVYRLRYSRGSPANSANEGLHEANNEFGQQSFERLVSDSARLENNEQYAKATNSAELDLHQKALAYRQLVDKLLRVKRRAPILTNKLSCVPDPIAANISLGSSVLFLPNFDVVNIESTRKWGRTIRPDCPSSPKS